eukprot:585011-Prorocentrum_lima.AAC.1
MTQRMEKEHQFLEQCFVKHHFLPCALGMGATSLTNKVCGLLHAGYFECNGMGGLQELLRSIISITTDLGTE